MKKILLILFILISVALFAQQSPQYSQYSFNNFGYNPAFAGTTKCLDFRLGSRLQWQGFEGAPRTTFVSAHKNFKGKHYGRGGYHSAGLYVEQDAVHLTTRTYIKLAYAYHLKLTNKFKLSMGVFAGVQQYTVNAAFGNSNVDPVLDAASGSVIRYPDIMPGVLMYSKKAYYSFSINQLLFKNLKLGKEAKQVNQYIFGAGHKSDFGDWVLFKSFLLKWNVMGPPALDLNLAWIYQEKISFGLGYRVGESVIANVKYRMFNALAIGYAFDFPLNKIYGNYGHEVMLSFSPCGLKGGNAAGGGDKKECAAYY